MLIRASLWILLIFLLSLHLAEAVQEQATECGNGMVQQLTVGDTASIVSGRLYDSPNGAAIGRLAPNTQLSIVGGPECSPDGQSWWQVEIADGRSGWISEGADGNYALILIAGEDVNSSADTCASLPAPLLKIGYYAELTARPPQFWLVRGTLEAAVEDYLDLTPGQELIILAGPLCHHEQWLWHVTPTEELPVSFSIDEIWLAESDSTNTYMTIGHEPEFSRPLTFPEVLIEPVAIEETAPLIDVNSQISYFVGGGGGGGIYVNCWLGRGNSTANQLEDSCVQQLFPPQVEEITVIFYQPDGTLHETRNYKYATRANGPQRVLLLTPPSGIELPTGVWQVEYKTDSETRRRAYILAPAEYLPPILQACDGFSPILRFLEQEPESTLLLKLIKVEQASGYDSYQETGQWEIPVASDGSAAARIAYPVVAGSQYFWQLGENRATDNQLNYFHSCPAPITSEDAAAQPLEYGTLITGGSDGRTAFFYAFPGVAGDVITLHVLGVRGEDDPFLELYDPDGELIAENDDAEPPVFGDLDAALVSFTLPADGIYTIQVSNINDGAGFYYILTLEQ